MFKILCFLLRDGHGESISFFIIILKKRNNGICNGGVAMRRVYIDINNLECMEPKVRIRRWKGGKICFYKKE